MRPHFEFSTVPKANKINQAPEPETIQGPDRVLEKNKTYIMCVPVSAYEAKMTQVNADDADEDITFILRRTGEEVWLLPFPSAPTPVR